MRSSSTVSSVHFLPAGRFERERGLLGWASIEIGDLHIDAIAVRRTFDGRITLSYPERTDRHGRRHPTARPRDSAAGVSLDRQVIEAIRAMGFVL